MKSRRATGTEGGSYLGLNSGTSADHVDAILVDLPAGDAPFQARILASVSLAIPRALRSRLLDAPDGIGIRDLCLLDARLGEIFGRAALRAIEEGGLAPARVCAAGLHGQTVCHLPAPRGRSTTLQIGLPEAVAAIARVPVVSHFRQGDTAAGGEGAPLSPALDRALFGGGTGALVLNLGGIANLTAISRRGDRTLGFDVGPGNMLLDGIMRRKSGGRLFRDTGGRSALAGESSPSLLAHAFEHPFLARRRARSTGREEFGDLFLSHFLTGARGLRLGIEDLLATAAELTAEAAWRSFRRDVGPGDWGKNLWLCGGGIHNRAVIARLRERFEPAGYRVEALLQGGVTAANRECVLFAFLAREFVAERPTDLTTVTGALRPVLLGRWTPRPA
jgi:anhydro-N-acetylmuramic acid kinase